MYTRDTPGANRHHCKAATVASHVALSHAIALIHLVKWVEKRGHPERPKVLIEKSLSDWESQGYGTGRGAKRLVRITWWILIKFLLASCLHIRSSSIWNKRRGVDGYAHLPINPFLGSRMVGGGGIICCWNFPATITQLLLFYKW